MLWLFFLSIVTNSIAGITLAFDRLSGPLNIASVFNVALFEHGKFRLGVGVLAFVTGFLKLLSPVQDGAPFGDLLPALAGLVMGFSLAYGYYRQRTSSSDVAEVGNKVLAGFFDRNNVIIGIVGAVIGVLHIFLSSAVLL